MARLPERHHASPAALRLVHHEDQDAGDQHDRKDGLQEHREHRGALLRIGREVDVGALERADQGLLRVDRIRNLVLGAVVERALDLLIALQERRGLDVAGGDGALVRRHRQRLRLRASHRERHEDPQSAHDDQDVDERPSQESAVRRFGLARRDPLGSSGDATGLERLSWPEPRTMLAQRLLRSPAGSCVARGCRVPT